jgi:hypothetical protein
MSAHSMQSVFESSYKYDENRWKINARTGKVSCPENSDALHKSYLIRALKTMRDTWANMNSNKRRNYILWNQRFGKKQEGKNRNQEAKTQPQKKSGFLDRFYQFFSDLWGSDKKPKTKDSGK